MSSRRSRSRSRERDYGGRSSSRRSRSRSRSRERSHRERDSRDSRDERDRGSSDRGQDRGQQQQQQRYGAPPPAGYRPAYHAPTSRFNDPRAAPAGAAASSVPASYGHQPPAASASASASAPAADHKNESFLRFQQALQMHNAARQQPTMVNAQAATAAKQAATAAYYNSTPNPTAANSYASTPSVAAAAGTGAAAASSAKKIPLASLEELARQKKLDDAAALSSSAAAALKPVFLTKAERQAAALAKLAERQQEAQAQAAKQAEHMKQFLDAAARDKQEAREAAQRAVRKAAEERDRKREDDAKRRAGGPGGGNPALAVHANNLSDARELERGRERELELIRNHYLGVKDPTQRKVHIPASQKFKFNFDWNARDDTGVDTNALYKHKHEVVALYGRGFQGGVDRKEQKKKHNFYDELVQHRLQNGEVGAGVREEYEESEQETSQRLHAAVKNEPMDTDQGHSAAASASLAHMSAASLAMKSEKTRAREEREEKRAKEFERKNRHWSEKPLLEMEERDWRIFKEDFSISTRGTKVPNPLRYWKEAVLPDNLMRALEQAGYKEPTPIQRTAIPIGLQCRDVIGIAETGSGKTCAFLVPMLVYIAKQPQITQATAAEGPYALIMAPTRELAQQIGEECDKFSRYMNIRNVCAVGGLDKETQGSELAKGVEVLIGTPGRLYDLINSRLLVLNRCNYIVLDEADRMVDIGFESQIRSVMDHMASSNLRPEDEDPEVESEEQMQQEYMRRQQQMLDGGDDASASSSAGSAPARVYRMTMLFSATMPPRVEALAKAYLRHPVLISVGDRSKAASRVEQRVEWITSEGAKKNRLLELVQQSETPIIIFANLKQHCDSIHRWLSAIGMGSEVLHGSKSQIDRMTALANFKEGKVPVLVATDVAGRGLDVQGVKHVINYDMSTDIEKYTHRIGRTGRAGLTGLSTTFLLESDVDVMYDLTQILRASNQPVPPQLAAHEASKFKPGTVPQDGPSKPKGGGYHGGGGRQ